MSQPDLVAETARLLTQLRSVRPLVQSITNFVSMDVAANALLAIGASPAMVHAPEEVDDFVRISAALVVNIGTLSKYWVEGMETAARTAGWLGKPWVLDPVGVGATGYRNTTTARLLALQPTIVRGNASEIMASAKVAGLTDETIVPKGVDSAHGTDVARSAAVALAKHQRCVVAATGEIDIVTDGTRVIELANGSPLMTRVTALGCALSSIIGAFSALTSDGLTATVAAIGVYGVAGEIAAEQAKRPGSFRVAFIDALDAVSEADIVARLKVKG